MLPFAFTRAPFWERGAEQESAVAMLARAISLPGGGARLTPGHLLVLFLAAGLAWAWTVDQSQGMGSMGGTMGRGFVSFVVMWGLMMTAMMIPSAAPFASLHARTLSTRRVPRLLLFAAGYMTVWVASGIPAYALARGIDEVVASAATVGTVAAVIIFSASGLYQLTSWKYRCLSHCRSPIGQVLHYASYRGLARDFRVGLHHGGYCLACCWSLMILMAAFGFMNLWAMVGLAAIVAIEKYWIRGESFARVTGVAALVLAVAVIWVPELAPGLDGSGLMGG